MTDTNFLARSAHDVGLAAWFGGTLMGAVGVNESASEAAGAHTADVVGQAWSAWTPINLAAIGGYLVGGLGLTIGNKGRVATQQGVGSVAVAKTVVTAAALGATGYARVLGQRVIAHPEVDADSGVRPSRHTPDEVAAAQRQLRLLQWAIPVLTGTLVVLSAVMGEQQRPATVANGVFRTLNSLG